jgi:hypothetical protein
MKGMTRADLEKIENPQIRAQALASFDLAARSAPLNDIVLPLKIPAFKSQKAKGKKPNKTESAYNDECLGGRGQFNAITFKLAGKSRYTLDWYLFESGAHTVIEVKGTYKHHTRGRSLTAFKEARAQFPGFNFVWVERQPDGTFKERSV